MNSELEKFRDLVDHHSKRAKITTVLALGLGSFLMLVSMLWLCLDQHYIF